MKRRDTPVHLGTLASQADLGVHRKGKVNRRSAFGQPLQVTFRRKNEDLVLEKVDLEELEELFWTVCVLLQLEQLPEPCKVAVQFVPITLFLVDPVRRNAVFRSAVHLAGPDLDFIQVAAWTEDGRVK